MKQYSIGVVGHTGQVGSVVYAYFREHGYRTVGVRRGGLSKSSISDAGSLTNADVIFVCVPTPFDYVRNAADFSIIREVVMALPQSKIVILKSTMLPGTTEELQKARPDLKLLFNPEFLSRKTARADFLRPDRQIVGYTKRSQRIARAMLSFLPRGKSNTLMTSSEAELVKYAHNIFGALAITYANHLYDVTNALNLNYDKVIEAFTAPEDIKGLRRYTTIHHNNKRGFGGPCFPKDIHSFSVFCKKIGVKAEVINAAIVANKRLLRSQGLTEIESEKY